MLKYTLEWLQSSSVQWSGTGQMWVAAHQCHMISFTPSSFLAKDGDQWSGQSNTNRNQICQVFNFVSWELTSCKMAHEPIDEKDCDDDGDNYNDGQVASSSWYSQVSPPLCCTVYNCTLLLYTWVCNALKYIILHNNTLHHTTIHNPALNPSH